MNVGTAAPPAAIRARVAPSCGPAGGDDFAALLAGLGGPVEGGTPGPQEPVDGASTALPVPDPSAAIADEPAATDETALATQLPGPPVTPAPPPVDPASAEPRSAHGVASLAATPPAAGASVAASPAAASPVAESPGAESPGAESPGAESPGAGAPAPAPALATVGADVPPAPARTPPAATPATTAAPDALQLAVPAGVTGDAPVPVLDARTTSAPAAAPAPGAAAGADAVLPEGAALPIEGPVSDPLPAGPAGTPAPGTAEVGLPAQPTADPRSSAPAAGPPAAPPPPSPQTPAPPPAAQVAQLLAPVLVGPDGTYRLSLQLYPEELGAVQVELVLRGGEIRLALHTPDEAAQAALRSALPDLRADLSAGGLSATSLSVDDGRPGQSSLDHAPDRRRSESDGEPSGRRSGPYRDAEPAPRTPASHPDATLDLRM